MPTLMDNIPHELRELQRWVCANADSKRPMRCFEGKAASVSKPNTWGDYDEAADAVRQGIYEYAGFVFDGDGYVGIDIDCAFDGDGMPTDEALAAVMACASYTELSKSGKGFHIICKGELPFKGRNNRNGWEIYREGRYFVLTGRTVMFSEIAEAQAGIELVLDEHFSDVERSGGEGRRNKIWKPSWAVDEATGRMSVSYEEVSQGSRHLALVSLCGHLHSCGAHKSAVYSSALAANDQYMRPPIPEAEVRQVVDSVTRYRR
ncbi:primase C-terminal domain-containing protein [Adlercreutzia sp. ZJ242]|uniref:primase C-terminal domain-containing protein n=1 Tax=Adlercreutzia sp. ZJ242 TaxID=2709409 RepID=UPI0013EAA0F5|nr:primase C-terminal domain-containing protein [Adlercreutzia sp. ZJ242]